MKSTFSAQKFPHQQCGSVFIRLAVVASQTCQLAQTSAKIWTYSSSRSSEVGDFVTNRKRIYEFLLVINSNFRSCTISKIQWLIGWKLCIFHSLLLFGTPAPYVPFGISRWSEASGN